MLTNVSLRICKGIKAFRDDDGECHANKQPCSQGC